MASEPENAARRIEALEAERDELVEEKMRNLEDLQAARERDDRTAVSACGLRDQEIGHLLSDLKAEIRAVRQRAFDASFVAAAKQTLDKETFVRLLALAHEIAEAL